MKKDEDITFEIAFDLLLKKEGGYSNRKEDSGGETFRGITKDTAREHGYKGSIKKMPMDTIKNIYRKSYWNPFNLDEINYFPVAFEIFDTAVLCGPGMACKWIQQGLNSLSMRGKLWNHLVVDRKMGFYTLQTLKKCVNRSDKKDAKVFLRTVDGLQIAHFVNITEDYNDKDQIFYRGWIIQRTIFEKTIGDLEKYFQKEFKKRKEAA